MPNWCSNSVTFRHEDPAQIERMQEAFLAERLLSEFVPNPDGEGAVDWYAHNTDQWGTKWDTGGSDVSAVDSNSITLVFDTAWSPPIAFYKNLEAQGWTVEGSYYEPGMAFVGRYTTEFGDEYYDIPDNLEDIEDQIPNDLDECWGISENLTMWDEE